MKLSATIITYNEERNIKACLESLNFVDEIVVVDSGSTDNTEVVCREFPLVRFYHQPWLGFGRQKNAAIMLARGEWILSVDADEVVTPALQEEIKQAIIQSNFSGFWINRKNHYKGGWVKHSGWYPDYVLRLFKKTDGTFNDRLVHESVIVNGGCSRLRHHLYHYSFKNVSELIRKADSYSSAGAEMMVQSGRTVAAMTPLLKSIFTFFKTYILKRGILDGSVGLLISFSNAVGVFYRYYKCYEMKRDQNESKRSRNNI